MINITALAVEIEKKRAGKTNREIAGEMGIGYSTFCNVLRGDKTATTTLLRIATWLGSELNHVIPLVERAALPVIKDEPVAAVKPKAEPDNVSFGDVILAAAMLVRSFDRFSITDKALCDDLTLIANSLQKSGRLLNKQPPN